MLFAFSDAVESVHRFSCDVAMFCFSVTFVCVSPVGFTLAVAPIFLAFLRAWSVMQAVLLVPFPTDLDFWAAVIPCQIVGDNAPVVRKSEFSTSAQASSLVLCLGCVVRRRWFVARDTRFLGQIPPSYTHVIFAVGQTWLS